MIIYQQEHVTSQEAQTFLTLMVELVMRCEDFCQLTIISRDTSLLQHIKRKLAESNNQCKDMKIGMEIKGSPTHINYVNEIIDRTLQGKTLVVKDLVSKICDKKGISRGKMLEELEEMSLSAKGDRVRVNSHQEFESLANYLLSR